MMDYLEIRGLVHIHSSYSHDGELSLNELVNLCKNRGYEFMAISEHAEDINVEVMGRLVRECKSLSSDDLVFIPGLEYISNEGLHILALGVEKYLNFSDLRELIHQIHDQRGLAILAHVGYYRSIPYETLASTELDGVEVWNVKYDGRFAPKLKHFAIFEKIKETNKNIFMYGGLDLHKVYHFGKLSTCIRAKKNDAKEILTALKKGEFYLTNGLFTLEPRENLKTYKKIIFISVNLLYDSFKLGMTSVSKILKVIGVKPPKILLKILYRIL